MTVPTRRKIFDVVGESFQTDAGLPRQSVLLAAEPGDPIRLEREPSNPHDANAIAVFLGKHDIGHIGRVDAKMLAPILDRGTQYRAQVHRIKGCVPSAPSSGAVIAIAWENQELPAPIPRDDEQVQYREEKVSTLKKSSTGCFGLVLAMLIIPPMVGVVVNIL
ncbi:HIRAN domain-containing protein [Altererythrobacter sp.]|uniref:HIRAN domain-containing protein n=1 Tax=Altererythrobacter sp. TaxID=1872480 RepID=UPI003D01F712